MICPNCKTESFGAKWCPECGLRLEIDDVAGPEFNKPEKGDTQKMRPVSVQNDEPKPAEPTYVQRESAPKSTYSAAKNETRFTDRGFNYWITAIGVIAVLVVLFVILRLTGVIPTKEAPSLPSVSSDALVLEKEDSSTILKTGLEQLKLGNYDEAETVFKAVLETDPKNTEADTLYQIVYNYNRALKKIRSDKYEEARDFFDEIPKEYNNYSIKTDVENLDDEISAFENAHLSFSRVEEYIEDGNYEDALSEIALIDKNYLSGADAATLDEYSEEIEKFFEEQKKADASADDMSIKKAEIIITEYCEDLVMAVNSKDFSIVEKHMNGQLYNNQKTFVQSCIDQALTLSFDSLHINSVSPVSDTKWKVSVTEGETAYYSDGTQQSQPKNLTYTIEYIDSAYYLTAAE